MRCPCACIFAAVVLGATGLNVDSAPDVSKLVAEETRQNLQIHEVFQTQEEQDNHEVQLLKGQTSHAFLQKAGWVVALDRDLKTQMLIQTSGSKALPVKDACGAISCGSLKCPGGFKVTSVPNHCCPYCVNPDIKLAAAVTGATGASGGQASTSCKDVFCFPTMCTKAVTNPSGANGQCCATCPDL